MRKSALQVDAIVLAAGNSSRFGADKRLYLVDGVPMLQCAITAIVDAVNSVTVVLKSSDRDTLPQLLGDFFADKRVISLLLDKPEAGMGSNLAHAVANLPAACDGVIVMLADMPYVQSQTVQAVINAYEDEKIVAPVFFGKNGAEQRGHPVLFAKRFFSELMLLTGDNGARSVLQQHAQSVIFFPVSDSGILCDIDTPII